MKHVLFILTLLSLAAFHHSAHANAVLAEPMKPISISRMVSSSNLVTASTQFAGRTAANQSVYARAAVNISKASIANAYRARAFSPWGFALVAAITAAGYSLNEETKQILTEIPASQAYGSCVAGSTYTNKTATECLALIKTGPGSQPGGNIPYNWHFVKKTSSFEVWAYWGNNYHSSFGNFTPNNWADFEGVENPLGETVQITDSDLYDVFTGLSSSQKFDVVNNPSTGTPDIANIPEFDQKAQEISNNWDSSYDDDPATVPNPDTGEVTSDDPLPEDESDIDICKYDPDILACQDLGDTPDETPIDTQEINFDYSPVPFSSSAVCPAPKQLPGGFTYDYQPACDFATGVRPAVVVMALLAGVYLLVGFKR